MVQLQAAPGKPEDVSRVIQGIITGIGFLGAGHFTLTLGALLATLLVLLAGGRFERAVQRLFGDKPGPGRDN
jgi:uncharacterized membrane protein YhiD involved in acid resistance